MFLLWILSTLENKFVMKFKKSIPKRLLHCMYYYVFVPFYQPHVTLAITTTMDETLTKSFFLLFLATNKNRTHTDIRELAIHREMERIILQRKLKEVADDWATPVDSLTANVKKHAAT